MNRTSTRIPFWALSLELRYSELEVAEDITAP